MQVNSLNSIEGELVQGDICVSIIEPVQVNCIYLKLKGYEQAQVQVTKSVPDYSNSHHHGGHGHGHGGHGGHGHGGHGHASVPTKTITETYHEKREIFRHKVIIMHQKCTLIPGSYQFPFSFYLDNNLPGSFTAEFARGKGQVFYKIKGEVDVQSSSLFDKNIKGKCPIVINELLQKQLNIQSNYKEGNVTFLCCFKKGTASMAMTFDKNAYAPGECVNLQIHVDNTNSTAKLQGISLKLVQTVNLTARGMKSREEVIVCKSSSGPVLPGGKEDRILMLPLPANLEQTSRGGALANCTYSLYVALKVPYSPDIKLSQDVQIYMPSLPQFQMMNQLPPGWNPTVFPVCAIDSKSYVHY